MPLHDFRCAAHGNFESTEPICPHGCDGSFVQKVFLKAPGLTSDRTKGIDKNLRDLAADYRMTNMTNRNGSVGRPDPGAQQRVQEAQERLAPMWGKMPTGDGAVQQALAEHHAAPDNALAQVRESLSAPRPLPVAAFGSTNDLQKATT